MRRPGKDGVGLPALVASEDSQLLVCSGEHGYVVCSKLDARSRLEVLAKASELGLIGR